MLRDIRKLESILNLWDNLDNMILYMPLKQLKDKTHKVLVHEDDEHSGLYMLRVFTSKDDLNEYALNYKHESISFTKIKLEDLEIYMRRYAEKHIRDSIRLSKCVLSTVDIDRKVRDIEILWSVRHT